MRTSFSRGHSSSWDVESLAGRVSGRSRDQREEPAPESGRITWEEAPSSTRHSLPAATLEGTGLERGSRQETEALPSQLSVLTCLLPTRSSAITLASDSSVLSLTSLWQIPQTSLYSQLLEPNHWNSEYPN